MSNVKISLTILVPGATMVSTQECVKQLKKPVIVKKGKYAGKQAKDRKGNLLYRKEWVPDMSKLNRHIIKVDTLDENKQHKKVPVTYFTRKGVPAKQVINLSEESYKYFTSTEVPYDYYSKSHTWENLSKKQRLEWHLNTICEDMGGKMDSYVVFND